MARLIDNSKSNLLRKYHALIHNIEYQQSEYGQHASLLHDTSAEYFCNTKLRDMEKELKVLKIKMALAGIEVPSHAEKQYTHIRSNNT